MADTININPLPWPFDLSNDADVKGPSSATTGNLAVFADATGKVLSDGGAIPAGGVVATGAEVDTGTNNTKFVSPLAIADSKLVSGPVAITDGHLAVWDTNAKTLKGGGAVPTGDMTLAGVQSVTGLKTFDKDNIAMKGTSTGKTVISTANTSATDYTATLQAADGTIAFTSDVTPKANSASPSFTGTVTLGAGAMVLPTVPTSDGTATGPMTNEFVSGYSSTAVGDLVYLDVNSKWQKADKGTSVATYGGLLGIALEVKAADNAVKVALSGSIVYATGFPALTIGSPVYMDDAGAMVVARPAVADHVARIVGYAVHADKVFFCPSNEYTLYQ